MVNKRKPDQILEEQPTKKNTRAMSNICNICLEQVATDFVDENVINILCSVCKNRFHGECVGISSRFFYNLIVKTKKGWDCYPCRENKFQVLLNAAESVKTLEKKVEKNSNKFDHLKSSVDQALSALNDQINEVRSQVVNNSNAASVSNISSKTTNSFEGSFVQILERKNNLLMQNIPIIDNESVLALKNLVVRFALCLSFVLDPSSINTIIRLRGKSSSTEAGRPLTNTILMKFFDVSTKDEFFSKYIVSVSKKIFVSASLLGLEGTQRIYVNHHLTPDLAKIKNKATEMKKSGLITKVSARYDSVRVLVNGQWVKITNLNQLDELSST